MKKSNKGFTLVELLVVIAIIGILAVVAVPSLFKNIEKAKVADFEADVSAIKGAALTYYSEHNEYPYGEVLDNDFSGGDDSSNLKGFEVEGLSDPFKALSYKLIGKEGNDLILDVFLPDENQISKGALNKILKDIHGSKYDDMLNSVTIPMFTIS